MKVDGPAVVSPGRRPSREIPAVTEVTAEGNVAAPAFIARPPGIRIGDLLAGAADPQRFAVDLLEECIRSAAKAGDEALGLGAAPCPFLSPGEVVQAQPLLLGAGALVVGRFLL